MSKTFALLLALILLNDYSFGHGLQTPIQRPELSRATLKDVLKCLKDIHSGDPDEYAGLPRFSNRDGKDGFYFIHDGQLYFGPVDSYRSWKGKRTIPSKLVKTPNGTVYELSVEFGARKRNFEYRLKAEETNKRRDLFESREKWTDDELHRASTLFPLPEEDQGLIERIQMYGGRTLRWQTEHLHELLIDPDRVHGEESIKFWFGNATRFLNDVEKCLPALEAHGGALKLAIKKARNVMKERDEKGAKALKALKVALQEKFAELNKVEEGILKTEDPEKLLVHRKQVEKQMEAIVELQTKLWKDFVKSKEEKQFAHTLINQYRDFVLDEIPKKGPALVAKIEVFLEVNEKMLARRFDSQ